MLGALAPGRRVDAGEPAAARPRDHRSPPRGAMPARPVADVLDRLDLSGDRRAVAVAVARGRRRRGVTARRIVAARSAARRRRRPPRPPAPAARATPAATARRSARAPRCGGSDRDRREARCGCEASRRARLGRRGARGGGAAGDDALGLGRDRARRRGPRGAAEVAGGRVALVGVLGHRARDDGVEAPARSPRRSVGRHRRRGGELRPQLRLVALALERHAAGQRVVQDAAERVDVGAGVDAAAADLLGRDVVERPDPLAGAGRAGAR